MPDLPYTDAPDRISTTKSQKSFICRALARPRKTRVFMNAEVRRPVPRDEADAGDGGGGPERVARPELASARSKYMRRSETTLLE